MRGAERPALRAAGGAGVGTTMENQPTMPATDFAELLRAGIAAAKRGDKARARFLLRQAASLSDASALAWLWLASVAPSREEAIGHLEKALALDPGHERAREWLAKLQASRPQKSRRPWRCPLCLAEGVVEMGQCPTCRSVLTLDDVDLLLHNEKADRDLLRRAINRLEALSGEEVGHEVHLRLGLAYLNLRRVYEGITRLRVASQLHPADKKLRSAIDELARRLDQSTALVEHTERAAAAGAARRTILVVDDSPTVLKLVGMALERQGHAVLIAANPLQALARLDEAVPDLILLDITMPHMDGFQLCKLIKANPQTAGVPVVMLSGKDGLFDKVRGRLAGAVDHVAKPFDPAVLVQAVERHCRPA
jgi:twitching motility two-component system response regulator PilG